MKDIKDKDLMFSLLLDGEGGATNYNWKEIEEWEPEKGLLWLHFSLPENPEENWINKKSGIPKKLVEALLNERDKPKVIKDKDKLFLSLRAINFSVGENLDDMVFLHMYMEKNRIITIRHKRVLAIERIKMSLGNNNGPKDSNEFLLDILMRISHRIEKAIHKIEDDIDEAEDTILNEADMNLRAGLSSLRRQAINIRRFISPQREVLNYLGVLEVSWFKNTENYKIKELTEKYIRYLADIDSARDRAAITYEEINSIYSEQLNKIMYVLSLVATIFLPLTFITGLLGINVGGIPGSKSTLAFIIVCAILLILGVVEYVIFKIKKWI